MISKQFLILLGKTQLKKEREKLTVTCDSFISLGNILFEDNRQKSFVNCAK